LNHYPKRLHQNPNGPHLQPTTKAHLQLTFSKKQHIHLKMYLDHLTTIFTILVFLFGQTSAHFMLNYPNSLGFDDDKEGDAPCGSFDVTFDNATDFHVDGDAIALASSHPQADWLFRATLGKTATGTNWTDLLPVVSESGLGQFCEPSLSVPATWAGSSGIVQAIQHGDDGSLYQVRD